MPAQRSGWPLSQQPPSKADTTVLLASSEIQSELCSDSVFSQIELRILLNECPSSLSERCPYVHSSSREMWPKQDYAGSVDNSSGSLSSSRFSLFFVFSDWGSS